MLQFNYLIGTITVSNKKHFSKFGRNFRKYNNFYGKIEEEEEIKIKITCQPLLECGYRLSKISPQRYIEQQQNVGTIKVQIRKM